MNHLFHRNRMDPEIARILDLESVPPVTTKRWVARRKAQVVGAVQAGLLSIDEACDLYKLTIEEFLGWQQAIRETGVRGLQITKHRASRTSKTDTGWFGNA